MPEYEAKCFILIRQNESLRSGTKGSKSVYVPKNEKTYVNDSGAKVTEEYLNYDTAKKLNVDGVWEYYNDKSGNGMFESIDTNGRPYRVCQLDGTWGPVYDPCYQFQTCSDQTITTKDIINGSASGSFQKITNNNGAIVDNIKNIATLNGGSVTFDQFSDALNSSGAYKAEVEESCSSDPAFESGSVKRTCDVTTGEWDGELVSTCKLKTCGRKEFWIGKKKYIIGADGTGGSAGAVVDGNLNDNTSAVTVYGKYYTKSSGYEGAIALIDGNGTVNYAGYKYTGSCPDGYYCQNCEDNGGKFTFTCDIDAEEGSSTKGAAVWTIGRNSKGEEQRCVPISCSYADLKKKIGTVDAAITIGIPGAPAYLVKKDASGNSTDGIGNVVFNRGGGGIVYWSSTGGNYTSSNNTTNITSSSIETGGLVYAIGTKVELGCKTGYYESSDRYAECVAASGNNGSSGNVNASVGEWVVSGECARVCDRYDLWAKSGNDIISTEPGMPGSIFAGGGYDSPDIKGTVYDYLDEDGNIVQKSRYFADGATVNASCKSGYDESQSGGQSEAGSDADLKHAYKCVNGEWKRMGSCIERKDCINQSFTGSVKVCADNVSEGKTRFKECYYNWGICKIWGGSSGVPLTFNGGTSTERSMDITGNYTVYDGQSKIVTKPYTYKLHCSSCDGWCYSTDYEYTFDIPFVLSCNDGKLELRDDVVVVDYGTEDVNICTYCTGKRYYVRGYLEKGKEYTCDNNLFGEDPAPGKSKKCTVPGAGGYYYYANEGEKFTP